MASSAALSLLASAWQRGSALFALYLLSARTDVQTVAAFGFWYTIAFTSQALGAGTMSFILSRYLPSMLADGRTGDAAALARHSLKTAVAISGATALLTLLFHRQMGSGAVSGTDTQPLLLLTIGTILLLGTRSFLESLLFATSRFRTLALFGLVSGTASLLAIVGLGLKFGAVGAMAGLMLVSIVDIAALFLMSRWVLARSTHPPAAIPVDFTGYAGKMFLTNLISAPVNWICLVVITRTTADVATIALAHFVNHWFNVALFVSVGISRALLPQIARIADPVRQSRLAVAASVLLAVLAIPALGLAHLLTPHLIDLAGQDFGPGARRHLDLAFWAGALSLVSIPFGMWMLARGHSTIALLSNLSWLAVFAAGLVVTAHLPAMDRVFGSRTAAYVWLLAYNVIAFLVLAARSRASAAPTARPNHHES